MQEPEDAIPITGPVYIIDDDAEVRASLDFVLHTEGIERRAFGSAGEFLEVVDGLVPGCLLLDLTMPDVNGLELLTELRRRGFGWPVVTMTADSTAECAEPLRELGAIEVVEKPFDIDQLLDCLWRAHRLLDSIQRDWSKQ